MNTTWAAGQPGTLSGTVLDPQGAAVSNVSIEVRWNDVNHGTGLEKGPRSKTLKVKTNSAGEFSVNLQPGDWDVFAYLDGFAPTCTVVLIEPGKTTNTKLRLPAYAAMSIQ